MTVLGFGSSLRTSPKKIEMEIVPSSNCKTNCYCKLSRMSVVLNEVTKVSLGENFKKCVQGYHLINSEPLKEAVWEAVNAQVFVASGISVESKSSGSHSPGSDITCAIGNISNKSAKYDGKKQESFSVSSYRLTAVCSGTNCGTPAAIIAEIEKRKNFQYYSIIVREELESTYNYHWYLIPSDHPSLSPHTYEWVPMIGKRGVNKGKQVGWETNTVNGSNMSVSFSMSSQLWINVAVTEELKQYIVGTVTTTQKQTFDYLQLFDILSKNGV
jgi:hypothetical protein